MRARSLRALRRVILTSVLLFSLPQLVPAQSSLGSDQLDILKSISPEQRDQIMQQLGIGTGSSNGTADRSGAQQGANGARGAMDQQERRQQRPIDEDEADERIPRLRGEDVVIIEIELPNIPLPPRIVNQTLAPLYLSGQNPALAGAALQSQLQTPVAPNTQTAGTPAEKNPRTAPLSPEDEALAKPLIGAIRERNPYRLSRDGALSLPGFAPVDLLGLSEDQATLRLQSVPAFQKLQIRLTRLPLKRTGNEGLKPFGYDLFDQGPSSFAPINDVPVPADYVLGPGDQLNVQLYGAQNRSFRLTVSGDGRINFPEIGPLVVGGQTFTSVQRLIAARVEREKIGVHASLSMGETRSIRVFVVGDVKYPGAYTISGLGTMTSALFAASGIKPTGSLRDITLKRRGEVIRHLDLYDLLLKGSTADDAKLLPGDVVFIPPISVTVSVYGEVQRPAIYELRGPTSIDDLIHLAGGLTAEADSSKASLTRIGPDRRRVVTDLDPGSPEARAQNVTNGDILRVTRLRPSVDSGISLEGHVYTAGVMAYRAGMRLSDAIPSVDDLRPNADIHYVLIRRELPPDRKIAALSADLDAALQQRGSGADPELMPKDRILVFDLDAPRDRVIRPLLDELRLQATIGEPTSIVRIDGRAKAPGPYPLEQGMRVSDLVRAGGGLMDAAYGEKAELTRYVVSNGETRNTQLIPVDLGAVMRGDPEANLALQPFDTLSIKEVSEWRAQEDVTLEGEVRFPGTYSIKRGDTLRSIIERAGGLTSYAFAAGSVFTRVELKEREQAQLDHLTERLQNDLAFAALQGAAANQSQAGTSLSVGQSLLSQLRAARAVGRLVISLPTAIKAQPGSDADISLRGGDILRVPRFQQEVTVIGEVQNQTSHLYRSGLTRDEYIELSGGVSRRADRSKIYVVRADGRVLSNQGGRWFRNGAVEIRPGDTIVVPLDTERLPALPFWQAVTSIIYNLAISAAAVHSF